MDCQLIKKTQTFFQMQKRFGIKLTKITSLRSQIIMKKEQKIHYEQWHLTLPT